MSTPEQTSRPYSPEAAQSQQQMWTVKEQVWTIEEKLRDAKADPSERYDLLKQACFLIYGLFGSIAVRLKEEDRVEIEKIYHLVETDAVPEPPQIRTEPLQFRFGHAQYDLLIGDMSVAQCFDDQLEVVAEKIVLEPQRKAHAKGGVQRLWPLWSKLHWYLAKYGLWDFETRIYRAETGYDSARKREGLKRLQQAGGIDQRRDRDEDE